MAALGLPIKDTCSFQCRARKDLTGAGTQPLGAGGPIPAADRPATRVFTCTWGGVGKAGSGIPFAPLGEQ